MEYLNYSRQIAAQIKKDAELHRAANDHDRAEHLDLIYRMNRSAQKFILPDGGKLLDDKDYSALDNGRELHLPFRDIVLEYYVSNGDRDLTDPTNQLFEVQRKLDLARKGMPDHTVRARKRAVYVTEQGDPNWIFLAPCWFDEEVRKWMVLPFACIPRKNFKKHNPLIKFIKGTRDVEIVVGLSDDRIPMSDYNDEVGAVMDFLNALACKNVHVGPPKILKKAQLDNKSLNKGILPFDSYRILELDVVDADATEYHERGSLEDDRFRPREHLRRGHERRYKSGKIVWINDRTINEGIGHKVIKTYGLKAGKDNHGRV